MDSLLRGRGSLALALSLFFGKTGCRGGAAGMPLTAALPHLHTRRYSHGVLVLFLVLRFSARRKITKAPIRIASFVNEPIIKSLSSAGLFYAA